jgi:hypothetical protein
MRTPSKIAYGLILLISLTTGGHAASAINNSNVPPHTLRARPEKGNFTTLVLIDCRPDDRSRYDVLLDKEFPGAKLLYTSIDENVGGDVIGSLGFGSGAALAEYHHKELVIISGFERATTRIAKMTEEESAKIWDASFAPGRNKKPIKLHLLTTNNEVPEAYLRLVDSSRGTYRKLALGSDGSYR